MQSPFIKLERASVTKISHTRGLDSIRIDFDRDMVLIAYNNSVLDERRITIDDLTYELSISSDLKVESIFQTDRQLRIQLSDSRCIDVGLRTEDSRGPEAFQIIIPEYPPIVEQNE